MDGIAPQHEDERQAYYRAMDAFGRGLGLVAMLGGLGGAGLGTYLLLYSRTTQQVSSHPYVVFGLAVWFGTLLVCTGLVLGARVALSSVAVGARESGVDPTIPGGRTPSS